MADSTAGAEGLTTAPGPILRARGLGRSFGRRWAVSDVDLSVERGELIGVVGPDGAGKTTLLQMFAAILDPSAGSCSVLGFDTRREAAQITARIGYMSQGFTLYDRLTAEENLRFAAGIRSLPETVYRERRDRLLAMAGLVESSARPAAELSGGMRKKLSLCTNLLHEPELLVLDEPGLGVDPLSRHQLWLMLHAFQKRGMTVVVATSYMDEAERCDRVTLLLAGRVIEAASPHELKQRARGRVFEIVTPEAAAAAETLSAQPTVHGVQVLPDRVRFQRAGEAADRPLPESAIAGATPVDPSLEDVFVLHAPGGRAAASEFAIPHVESGSAGGVSVERATVTFGAFRAVDSVSLEIAPGELVALVGPNGAGKTTLMRALCGLLPLASGGARVAGYDVVANARRLRGRIGYVSQRFSLYPDLTADENLEFFASAYGLRAASRRAALGWARELVLPDGDPLVSDMSGATRQRLALACSLLHLPSVLVLDEPTSGVDPITRYEFWRLIRSLAARGMTVLVSTHHLEETIYCDRIALMMQGRLIFDGSEGTLRREVGGAPSDSTEQLFVRAVERARATA